MTLVLLVLHRLIARQILFAEDRCLTIERFIPVDELDYLALRVVEWYLWRAGHHPSLRWSQRGHSLPRS
jgi:hypothetical protein